MTVKCLAQEDIFRTSEMPFPMFSRGKFHISKHENNANYSVTLLFICHPLELLIYMLLKQWIALNARAD